MARSDVTAAFILTSSIAILASAQEMSGSKSLLPPGTTHLAGHGFIGTLTSLVASSQLDLPSAVRLAVRLPSLTWSFIPDMVAYIRQPTGQPSQYQYRRPT